MKSLTDAELLKPRKRRLNKKLRVGEFCELGFELTVTFSPSALNLDALLDEWIDFVERQGWFFAGGSSANGNLMSGFAFKANRASMTDDDRNATLAWLNQQAWCVQAQIGPLIDAWHHH